jgi:hypothetical protein
VSWVISHSPLPTFICLQVLLAGVQPLLASGAHSSTGAPEVQVRVRS